MISNGIEKMGSAIKVIGFDADDTLWVNELLYRETERQYCEILKPFLPENETIQELFKTEMQNLELYGFGAKGFILSMIETALRISDNKVTLSAINRILAIGKNLLNEPVVLINNVEKVLRNLQPKYKLILATKGDLLDQERKLKKSGLSSYFHHIEIMSNKQEGNYIKLLKHLDIKPHEFLMIGNSVKSDILPVINIGAKAIHVPYEITWQHENDHETTDDSKFITVDNLLEIIEIL